MYLCAAGAFDADSKLYDKGTVMRTQIGCSVMLSSYEIGLVNGVRGMMDCTKYSLKHSKFWTLEDIKVFTTMMNVSGVSWKPDFHCFVNRHKAVLRHKFSNCTP